MGDVVWFMGPVNGPGFYLLRSDRPAQWLRPKARTPEESSRPPNFAWKSMDRKWHFAGMPQGYTAMNWRTQRDERTGSTHGWSVLSVTDYTQDSRPNVMVSFAVHRPRVSEGEMRELAAKHYPSIWARLKVRDEHWTPGERRGDG